MLNVNQHSLLKEQHALELRIKSLQEMISDLIKKNRALETENALLRAGIDPRK